jgi:hypothetical protein
LSNLINANQGTDGLNPDDIRVAPGNNLSTGTALSAGLNLCEQFGKRFWLGCIRMGVCWGAANVGAITCHGKGHGRRMFTNPLNPGEQHGVGDLSLLKDSGQNFDGLMLIYE